MKISNLFLTGVMALAIFASCEETTETPDREYPAGAVVWPKDTVVTLTDHYIIPKNTSLYIEEGVQVIMDNLDVRPEFIVLGNLYSYGTTSKPVLFSVKEANRTEANRFERQWGGIICGYESEEVLLLNTVIEFGGAQTTEESESFKNQLFKTETGEGVPGFHFCNPDGEFVIDNCIFRNNAEDHIYITGGKSIIMNSRFIHSGFDGGEAINYKSDCLADLAYNLIYDANTNAFKLSNSGLIELQSHLFIYNNTIVNTGWRRPKIKGGSIWLEDNIRAEIYNNILFDTRHAVKQDVEEPQDPRTVITPNFLFASTAEGITQYTANADAGILNGANDKKSTEAGTNNPNFKNFTIQANVDILQGVSKSENVPQTYNVNWDFHLSAGSPALTGGKTDFTRHFGTTGITIDSKEYKSPAPAAYFGAFGQN